MPFRPSIALLAPVALLLACGAEPAPANTPDASPPCGGACGAGTVCEGGRCVAVDAGPDAATADAPPPPPDAAPDVAPPLDAAPDAAPEVGVDAAPRCDADLQTDNENCGACRNWCGSGGYCYRGNCVRTCATPAGTPTGADCDGNAANGCETPLGTNTHCGGCGNACAAPLECFPIRAGMVTTGYRCM